MTTFIILNILHILYHIVVGVAMVTGVKKVFMIIKNKYFPNKELPKMEHDCSFEELKLPASHLTKAGE